MFKIYKNKIAIFTIYLIIAFPFIQTSQCQNSLTGDGFGGRQWYISHNYQVGAYSAYTVCGSNNQLYGWGNNRYDELGNGTYASTTTPIAIPGMTNVKFYTTGYISGAIKNDNTAWVWGDHSSHFAGMPILPSQVLTDVKFIDGGMTHIVFVKNDGTVWGMGRNDYGELGNGSTSTTPITSPVQMVGITNAVRAIVVSYTIPYNPPQPPNYYFYNAETLILLSDGSVKRTGGGGSYQAANSRVPVTLNGLNNIVDIKGNTFGALALDANGDVYSFGTSINSTGVMGLGSTTTPNTYIPPTRIIFPFGAKPIVALSCNNDGFTALALDSSHQLYGWGNNFEGQLGNADSSYLEQYSPQLINNNVKDIFAGETFSYILKNDNTLMAAGSSQWDYLSYNYGSIWMNLSNIKRNIFTIIDPASMNLCTPKPFGCGIPSVNLGNDTTLCPGNSISLTAPLSTSYLWSTGATTQSISVLSTGQYWVKIGNSICFSSDTINISFSIPQVNLGNDTTLCQGQNLILNAGTASNYLWSTGASSQTINVTTAGQYWVKANNGNCFKTDTINVGFTSPPNVNLGNDTTLCQGQNLILNAGAASTYLWSTGTGSQTINVTTAGQYWVKASNGNCFKADTINVAFTSLPNVDLGSDTTLCQGQNLILNAGVASTYLWSTGASSQTINVTTAEQYWVKASNANCMKADTIGVSYKVPPALLFSSDTTLCSNQTLTLNAGNASKYLWSTGETTQAINVLRSGSYFVNINYYKTCQKQYFVAVKFEDCDCILYMPNAFTPNSDGRNDTFKPAMKSGCQFLTFSILNRYGQKVFESSDLNKGWDGKFKGIQEETGVFVWMITAIHDGQNKLFKGTLILIR